MSVIRQRQRSKNTFLKANGFAGRNAWSWKLIKERTKNLKRLGYFNFPTFLKSAFFKELAAKHFTQYPLCKKCKDPAKHIHFTNYRLETLKGTKTVALISLCESCYQTVTFTPEGTRRSPEEANKVVYHWHTKPAPKNPTTEQQPETA